MKGHFVFRSHHEVALGEVRFKSLKRRIVGSVSSLHQVEPRDSLQEFVDLETELGYEAGYKSQRLLSAFVMIRYEAQFGDYLEDTKKKVSQVLLSGEEDDYSTRIEIAANHLANALES